MGYLQFYEIPNSGKKTKTFDIANNLGQIKWYAPWRQYCFFPVGNTVFDTKCMQEIIDFIDKLMQERKTKL